MYKVFGLAGKAEANKGLSRHDREGTTDDDCNEHHWVLDTATTSGYNDKCYVECPAWHEEGKKR